MKSLLLGFHAFLGDGILNKIAYSTGTANMVKSVPKVNPAMTVAAMDTQKTSCSSGITPRTVVAAASNTGRRRDTPDITTAS